MTKVFIMEYEAGWGSRVDEVLEFDTKEEAAEYALEYNIKYNPPLKNVPSWYMVAEVEGNF